MKNETALLKQAPVMRQARRKSATGNGATEDALNTGGRPRRAKRR